MDKILIIFEDLNKSDTSIHKSYVRGFTNLGFKVSTCDTTFLLYNNRLTKRLIKISLIYKFISFLNYLILRKKKYKKFYLILVIKGSFLNKKTINFLKKESIKGISYFNPDDPFNKKTSNDLILNNLKYYNTIFHWNENQLQDIKNFTKGDVIYLDFGIDDFYFNDKLFYDENYKYDSVFIGNGDEDRISFFRKLDYNLKLESINIVLFGDNWPRDFKNIKVKSKVNVKNMKIILSSSLSSINILRSQNKNSTNMRTFEIPSLGCVLIHEKSKQAENIFENGKEMMFFENQNDIIESVKKLKNNKLVLNTLRKNAFLRSQKGDFTYTSRCKQILD